MCGVCWPAAPNKTNNGEEAEASRGMTAADATEQGNLTYMIRTMMIVSDGYHTSINRNMG